MEEAIKGEIVHEEKHDVAPAHHAPKKSKNKNLFIIIGVVLAVAVLAGGYFFIANRNAEPQEEEMMGDSEVVETLTAEELGLSISVKPDGKAVKFKIEKAGDIKNVEYQLTYEADSTAQERAEGGEDRVQRGVTGEATISGKSSYESEWLDLGSCSRNVCKYDSGVDSVDLTLKLVKKNGKTYEAQTTHSMTD